MRSELLPNLHVCTSYFETFLLSITLDVFICITVTVYDHKICYNITLYYNRNSKFSEEHGGIQEGGPRKYWCDERVATLCSSTAHSYIHLNSISSIWSPSHLSPSHLHSILFIFILSPSLISSPSSLSALLYPISISSPSLILSVLSPCLPYPWSSPYLLTLIISVSILYPWSFHLFSIPNPLLLFSLSNP